MNLLLASVLQRFAGAWDLSDTPKRSLAKTISWRITGSGATFAISYAISGNFAVSGTIAAVQLVCNTILYFVHERIWDKLSWGRINSRL
jgi:uncharacterized membrane protein